MSKSRIRLNTGTLTSPRLEQLATSHPFVQQIDIVLPSRTAAPDDSLVSLKTTYSTAQFTLSELYEYASHVVNPDVPFKAVPVPAQRDVDDTWCIDPRGVLTLCVSKNLYEQLGLVGQKLPFKGCPERYVIRIPLKQETTSVGVRARQKNALAIWDRLRVGEGLGRWRVAYVGGSPVSAGNLGTKVTTDVTPRVRRDTDVYVPLVGDLVQSTEETTEDHQERLEALLEWVGMACLGAQRLRANDRVDPYVAVYEAPSPALVGDVVHICWIGLMDSSFVQSVIDTAISTLSSGDESALISVTLHSHLDVPVSFIPESAKEPPLRAPGSGGEDTVCVVLSKSSTKTTWTIAESIGEWDARWG